MFQMASPQDRAELKDLWQLCFQESQPFLDWFFTDRFLPAYCPIYREDGVIQAALHGLPAHMRVRDRIAPCVIIAGVATHPDFRGRGLMRGLLGYYLPYLGRAGIPLATHRPVTLRTYASAGHFPVSDSRYLSLAPDAPRPAEDPCQQVPLLERASELYGCYQRFSLGYSCILSRSYADFFLKCKDYLASDAKCILTRDAQGQVEGYCVYFDSPGEGAEPPSLYGEECVALSPEAYARLWASLAARSQGKALKVRMAPNAPLCPAGAQWETLPRSVWGVANVSCLLAALGLPGEGVLQVEDPLVEANRGLYDLCGRPAQGKPQLVIPAGRLAQWASGYRTMAQLVAEGQAQALDPAIVPILDAGHRLPCFTIDEY